MQLLGWFLALLTAIGAGVWVYRTEKRRNTPQAGLLAFLRALLVLLVWLLLLSPTFSLRQNLLRKPTVVLLLDDSRSAGAALRTDSGAYRQKIQVLQQALGKDTRLVALSFGTTVEQGSRFRFSGNATNLSEALKGAAERSGKAHPSFVILATDGRLNTGPNPLFEPAPFDGSLHILAIGDSSLPKDLRLGRIYAPRTVARGAQFEVRADFYADGASGHSGAVALQGANGQRMGSSAFTVSGGRYDRSVTFTLSADRAGIHSYLLHVPSLAGEANVQNNTRRFYVEVVEQKKKILIAAAAPHPDIKALREALATVDRYEVQVQTGSTVPATGYDVAILHGLPTAAGALPSGMPCWYIVSPTTFLERLNAVQKAATFSGPSGGSIPVYAAPSGSFTAFTPPPGLAALFDRMPPLFMPQAAVALAADAQVLLMGRDSRSPLWMLRKGTPLVALTAGEGLWRWRLSEYRQRKEHNLIDECIRQTVAFLASGNADRRFRLEMPKWEWSDGEGVVLNGYLLNAANQTENTAEVGLTLTDSAGRQRTYRMERAGSGYRLNFGALLPGSYRYNGRVVADGKTYTDGGSFVVQEMPLELLQTGADYPYLNALAARYEGTVRPWQQADALVAELRQNDALKPRLETNEAPRPLIDWKGMFFLILAVATAEWLLRRYRSV